MTTRIPTLLASLLALLTFPIPRAIPQESSPELLRYFIAALPPEGAHVNSGRIIARLYEAESVEENPNLAADYRISYICVALAAQGSPLPHIEATYRVLGCHPDQVWPRIEATRRAKLGAEYDQWYDQNGNLRKDGLCVTPADFSAAPTTDSLAVAATGARIQPAGTRTISTTKKKNLTTSLSKKPSQSVRWERKERVA